MAVSPDEIAEKLASIIDEKGPSSLTDDPYGAYQEILKSGTADRRTAGALLHVLVSGVAGEASLNPDMYRLSSFIMKSCCLNKTMSDFMAEVLSDLYSEENLECWKMMDRNGLRDFLIQDFKVSWKGSADWSGGGGSVHCSFDAEIVLTPSEKAVSDSVLAVLIGKNPFMSAGEIHDYFAQKLTDYLDDKFEWYCSAEEYCPPVAEDFELDYYLADWCKNNGFAMASCDGEGSTSDFDSDY